MAVMLKEIATENMKCIISLYLRLMSNILSPATMICADNQYTID